MDDIIAFIHEFIKRDYEARRAAPAEPDDAKFAQCVAALDELFDIPGGSGISRAPNFATNPDPRRVAARKQTLERMRPRKCFLIRQYNQASFPELYRCYVDSGIDLGPSGYFESLFVARRKNGLRIVSRWGVCLTCRGAGVIDGSRCGACGGSGWEPAGGALLRDLGPETDVRRLVPPSDPSSLADYNND